MNSDEYLLKRGSEITFYYSGYKYGFDSASYYDTYFKTNEWESLDLDSLANSLSLKYDSIYTPDGYSANFDVEVFESGIVYSNSDYIDTFKIENGHYQENKKITDTNRFH